MAAETHAGSLGATSATSALMSAAREERCGHGHVIMLRGVTDRGAGGVDMNGVARGGTAHRDVGDMS